MKTSVLPDTFENKVEPIIAWYTHNPTRKIKAGIAYLSSTVKYETVGILEVTDILKLIDESSSVKMTPILALQTLIEKENGINPSSVNKTIYE